MQTQKNEMINLAFVSEQLRVSKKDKECRMIGETFAADNGKVYYTNYLTRQL